MEDINIDNIYDKTFDIGDMFLIVIDNIESIANVKNIDYDLKNVVFTIDTIDTIDKSDVYFKLDEDDSIILKTDNYTIIDIEKIISFDFAELDTIVNTLMTRDIYSEIEIKTIDVTKYIYTDIEKRESLVSSLIISMKIYDDSFKIKNITNISQVFIEMLENKYYDTFDHFQEINDFNKNKVLPYWLIPVSKDIKKIYVEDDIDASYDGDDSDDIVKVDFMEEYNEIDELYNSEKSYQNVLNIYNNQKYRPIQNLYIEHGYKLDKYIYDYFRACIDNNTCTGINGHYSIDTRKNNNGLILHKNDSIETLIKRPICNISKLLFLSDDINLRLPFKSDSRILSLGEKCLFIENNYSVLSNNKKIGKLNKSFVNIDCKIDPDDMFDFDSNKNYDSSNSYLYNINDTLDLEEFSKILYKYLPNQNTILDKYLYTIYNDVLYNYGDFNKLMIKYNLNVENIKPIDKLKINDSINKNIKRYINSYNSYNKKIKYDKNLLIQKKYSVTDKLELLLNYINRLIDIPYQNDLLDKYIKNFTIHNKSEKTLDNKYNNTKIMCEHYLYQCKTHKDDDAYTILINKYGEKIDGSIYCNICGNYLDNVELSNYEGFSENKPIFKEAIVDEIEDIEFTKLQEFIELLGKHIGTTLNETDIIEIADLYGMINDNMLSDYRFDVNESFTRNNEMIKNIYNTQVDKKKIQKGVVKIQKYIIETNKILFLYSCILLYIQTSIPSYNINLIIIDLSDNSYLNKPKIDKFLISKSLKLLNRLNSIYENDIDLDNFLIDGNVERSNVDPDVQLENTIKYLLNPYFQKILNRIDKYKLYKGYFEDVYLNEYWVVYRPLPTNKNILSINKIINESIPDNKKYIISNVISTYNLENISMLVDLKKSENTEKYKSVDIKNLELLNNKAFLRLYDYILSLSGYQKIDEYKNNYIELLIDRFYETSKKDGYIKTIFNRYDWKADDKISFKELRKILIGIFTYCKDKGDCIASLKIFNHIELNNSVHLNFLSTYPKRNYPYIFLDPLPSEFTKTHKIINKLYDVYCYDINDKIIKRGNLDTYYRSLYIETDFRYNPCKDNISISDTQFYEILNKIYMQNKFSVIYKPNINRRNNDIYSKDDIKNTDKKNLIETRLIDVFNYGEFKNIPSIYNLLLTIKDYTNINILDKESYEKIRKLLDSRLNDIIDDTKCMVDNIIEFTNTNINIDQNKKQSLNLLNDLFNDKEINNIYYLNTIDNILLLISKIKNNKQDNNYIPETWKFTESNTTILKLFLKNRQYLLHNDIFNPKKPKMKGYDEYFNESYKEIFTDLYNMYENFKKHLNLIVGKKNNIFLDTYAKYLLQYMLALTLYKIVEFINLDDTCDIEMDGNELYNAISESINFNRNESEKILSKFLGDVVLNTIQEYSDTKWLIQIGKNNMYLQNKLAEQKEIEKQVLLKKKDGMTGEQRLVNKQLEQTGMTNLFKDSEKYNQEKAEYEQYENSFEDSNGNDGDGEGEGGNGGNGGNGGADNEGYFGENDFNADGGDGDGDDNGDEDYQSIEYDD